MWYSVENTYLVLDYYLRTTISGRTISPAFILKFSGHKIPIFEQSLFQKQKYAKAIVKFCILIKHFCVKYIFDRYIFKLAPSKLNLYLLCLVQVTEWAHFVIFLSIHNTCSSKDHLLLHLRSYSEPISSFVLFYLDR